MSERSRWLAEQRRSHGRHEVPAQLVVGVERNEQLASGEPHTGVASCRKSAIPLANHGGPRITELTENVAGARVGTAVVDHDDLPRRKVLSQNAPNGIVEILPLVEAGNHHRYFGIGKAGELALPGLGH